MIELLSHMEEVILVTDTYRLLLDESGRAARILLLNIHWVLLGVIIGMLVGSVPGMGGSVGLALLLPFTLNMEPQTAFAIFGGLMGASTFSGSLTAILFNVPGSGANAATVFDGYPLTRKGEAARAIGASAFSSATGAIVGLLVFFLMIPIVIEVVLFFGPSEIFWVIIIGLSVVPFILGTNKLLGIAIACLGLIFSFVGRSTRTGESRFVHGQAPLLDGIDLIAAVIGLFAFAEMIRLAAKNEDIVKDGEKFETISTIWDGVRDVIKHKYLWFRCSLIGIFVGAIPGAGGAAANFVSYTHAIQTSSTPEKFGKGNIEGVIAAESSNDSKDGGQLFPTMGLGIPGSSSTAVLLGGFYIHGILPGPNLLVQHLDLMLIIFFGLVVGNIATSVIGIVMADHLARVVQIPISTIFPVIIVLGIFATFAMRNSFFDITMALVFGLIGLVLMLNDISRVPIVIALVLGTLMETNFHLAWQLSDGIIDGLLYGTLNRVLIIVLLLLIVYSYLESRNEGDRKLTEEVIEHEKGN